MAENDLTKRFQRRWFKGLHSLAGRCQRERCPGIARSIQRVQVRQKYRQALHPLSVLERCQKQHSGETWDDPSGCLVQEKFRGGDRRQSKGRQRS